jgi:hypothetical protein
MSRTGGRQRPGRFHAQVRRSGLAQAGRPRGQARLCSPLLELRARPKPGQSPPRPGACAQSKQHRPAPRHPPLLQPTPGASCDANSWDANPWDANPWDARACDHRPPALRARADYRARSSAGLHAVLGCLEHPWLSYRPIHDPVERKGLRADSTRFFPSPAKLLCSVMRHVRHGHAEMAVICLKNSARCVICATLEGKKPPASRRR